MIFASNGQIYYTKRAICACFLLSLTSCAPEATYRDISGLHRGNSALRMDGAVCQQTSAGIPMPAGGGGCTYRCAGINAAAGIINQQNAFSNCMLSRGWQEVD